MSFHGAVRNANEMTIAWDASSNHLIGWPKQCSSGAMDGISHKAID
jgi:hypothetical protein